MFRKNVKKEDPTELELLKIRVKNLEKQVAELKRAPQVQAEELGVGLGKVLPYAYKVQL